MCVYTHTCTRTCTDIYGDSGVGVERRHVWGEGVAGREGKGRCECTRCAVSMGVRCTQSACLSLSSDCLILVERNTQPKCRGD